MRKLYTMECELNKNIKIEKTPEMYSMEFPSIFLVLKGSFHDVPLIILSRAL